MLVIELCVELEVKDCEPLIDMTDFEVDVDDFKNLPPQPRHNSNALESLFLYVLFNLSHCFSNQLNHHPNSALTMEPPNSPPPNGSSKSTPQIPKILSGYAFTKWFTCSLLKITFPGRYQALKQI
jgi:hypothetical protein